MSLAETGFRHMSEAGVRAIEGRGYMIGQHGGMLSIFYFLRLRPRPFRLWTSTSLNPRYFLSSTPRTLKTSSWARERMQALYHPCLPDNRWECERNVAKFYISLTVSVEFKHDAGT